MFCPSCEAEYRDGFTECSDCGVTLVATLEPAPQDEVREELAIALLTADTSELAYVVDRLEKAGVPYVVEAGTALALLDGGEEALPHEWRARLSVTGELRERAARIVEKMRVYGQTPD